MEIAIETLQDRIIYLTGQIVMIEKERLTELQKESLIKKWNKEIEELKKAQNILICH